MTKEQKHTNRFYIYITLKNGNSTIWTNGGFGFTQEEADNIIRNKLVGNKRVEKYTIKAMKNSVLTR